MTTQKNKPGTKGHTHTYSSKRGLPSPMLQAASRNIFIDGLNWQRRWHFCLKLQSPWQLNYRNTYFQKKITLFYFVTSSFFICILINLLFIPVIPLFSFFDCAVNRNFSYFPQLKGYWGCWTANIYLNQLYLLTS